MLPYYVRAIFEMEISRFVKYGGGIISRNIAANDRKCKKKTEDLCRKYDDNRYYDTVLSEAGGKRLIIKVLQL